jgi:formylglycine-generating enzyme required for sulfatase activity
MDADGEQAREGEPKARIFISYSRKDMAFADRLEAALKARGFEPLIDRTEIYAFEDWWKRIEALIGRADTIVFVLSPDAVTSDVALKEVTHAASLNKRFAPIACRRVEGGAVPQALRRLNFIFFDDPARFDVSADALATALQTDIGWIRRHTEFGEVANRWARTGRPGGLLLRPPVLEEAEYWIAYRPHGAPPPTAETQTFIAESRKAEVVANRRKRLVQSLIYVLAVGIIAGLVGWIFQSYLKEEINWVFSMRPYAANNVRPYVLTAAAERALKPLVSFRECAKDCPEMIVVQAGSFMMGSPLSEKGRDTDESPQHAVTISKPFAVSKFDVTFSDWDACVSVGGCPHLDDNGWGRGTRPAINVSWDQAQRYVAWFSTMTGKSYRLLTETEWEYAARAGTTTAYYWGDDIGTGNANCDGCGTQWDNKQTSPVGSFKPNAFGLYDMAGNVFQLVQDCNHDNYEDAPTDGSAWTGDNCSGRVVRGGSWFNYPQYVRSADRDWNVSANDRLNFIGFRLGRTLSVDGAITVAPGGP